MSEHVSRGGRQAAYRRSQERWRNTADDRFAEAVQSCQFAADVLRALGFDLSGGNYQAVRRRVTRLNLDTSHWHRGRPPAGRSLDSVLVPGGYTNRHRLKLRLLRAGRLRNVCAICGLSARWNDQPLMLVLDHINGINNDYRMDNLRLLCPNRDCISKTTYVEYVMPRLPNTSPQTLRVLELLLESPRSWHYGYALSQLTGLKSGTLYPILLRLADQGWLETRWAEPEQPGRPPRHTYRLTGQGARTARTKLAEAAPLRMTRRLASVPGSG